MCIRDRFYVTLKMAEDRDDGLTRMFFKAFRENFKPATKLWLILLAAVSYTHLDVYKRQGLTYTAKLTVETLAGDFPADAVILATGASRAAPRIPGLAGLEGRGVSY